MGRYGLNVRFILSNVEGHRKCEKDRKGTCDVSRTHFLDISLMGSLGSIPMNGRLPTIGSLGGPGGRRPLFLLQ